MDGKKRGFASMSPERLAEIARKGGKSSPPSNRPFAKDRELAKRAGRKGGKIGKPGARSKATDAESLSAWHLFETGAGLILTWDALFFGQWWDWVA